MNVLNKVEVENSEWFLKANQIADALFHFIQLKEKEIYEEHKPDSSSVAIQRILLPKLSELGFESEKQGLFNAYPVSSLRPDYYLSLGSEKGIIVEIERGRIGSNNMDLLDFWKCHICKTANCLFLIVPINRPSKNGKTTPAFAPVHHRLSVFFQPKNHVNVDAVFLFGY